MAKFLRQFGTKRSSVPTNAKLQLATLVSEPPSGDQWGHEIKFDGYRMLCRIKQGEKTRFISRNGKDWTMKFADLALEAAKLPIKNALIDGEVVILDAEGRSSFQLMQNAFKASRSARFLFYAFDLIFLNGYDVGAAPLKERKAILEQLIPQNSGSVFKYSEHLVGQGAELFAEAARLKLEGIVSKRLDRPYVPGRGYDWLKTKCSFREEFVVGGFTKPSGGREHFGALLLGYHDRAHQLMYAGRVGTGFNARTLASLRAAFEPLIQEKSPFKNLSGHTGQARGVTWLKPALVAQVEFSNWTDERQLRHPSFQGLREDKPAREVVREDPISITVVRSANKAASASKQIANSSHLAGVQPAAIASTTAEIAGVSLSHPDKVLYPSDGITKADLAHYYEQVALWMLPQIKNRLLSLVRCPAGSGQKCFFQKHPGPGTSDVFPRFQVQEKQKIEEHITVTNVEGLISLVQMGVLEIHVWGSQADRFEQPDRLVFDLDPDPTVAWPEIVRAAKEVRLLLQELGLVAFVKTTGGKGLHIVVPIAPRSDWQTAKDFCRAVADLMVAAAPDRYIAKMSKAARKNKIFVDYLRNDRGATAIAPYSTRTKAGATVSMPISWNELSNTLTSDAFNIRNVPERLKRLRKDPWAEIGKVKQSITREMFRRLKSR